MRLVMTLRTRDHVDLVDEHLAFHLNAGVDFVVATDHRSRDGTREVLERYEQEGRLLLIRKDGERFEREWLSEMAWLATTEHDADWVIHSDADEFWWPRGGNLKDVLGSVPARFGAVQVVWRHFAPRPADGSHFAERMTARLAAHGPWMGSEHPFFPSVKVAHRADPLVTVGPGNHDVAMKRPPLRGWFPIELLHFPLRTPGQAEAKFAAWGPVLAEDRYDLAAHVSTAAASIHTGRFRSYYDRYVVDDAVLAEGLRTGWLCVDTRLRDALRRLAGDAREPLREPPRFRVDRGKSPQLEFPQLGVGHEAALADDVSALADPRDRARQRVESLESRVAALERPYGRRILARGRRAAM